MNIKTKIKLLIDIAMTVILLLLMSYSQVGEVTHKWLGVCIFTCFILHHILNKKWTVGVLKGKYTPLRVWQTALVILVFISMLGSMFSGIIISEHIFSFIRIRGLSSLARTIHMLAAYWGLIFMSLHLGFHWSMMVGMANKASHGVLTSSRLMLRAIRILIAVYGMYAFIKRDIFNYMILKNHFANFSFEESVIFFLLDYVAVMGLFVWIAHYITEFIKHKIGNKKKHI